MSRTTRNRAAPARRRADDVVALAKDLSLVAALGCRARVEIAQGELDQAGDDARRALDIGADSHGYVTIPDAFECLAYIAGDAGSYQEAAAFSARPLRRDCRPVGPDSRHWTPIMNSGSLLFEKPWGRVTSKPPGMKVQH